MAQHGTTAPGTPTSAFGLEALFGVQSRRILITGGGSGLGSYAALAYALHGARVFIVGRREDKLESVKADFEARKNEAGVSPAAKQGSITCIKGDVSTKDSVKAIMQAYSKHEDALDTLVNCAGLLCQPPKVDKHDGHAVVNALFDDDWDNFSNLYNVNVTGLHYMTLAAAPYLVKSPAPSLEHQGPSVINVTSIAGHHLTRESPIPYMLSKDAAEKLTKIMVGRFMPLKIRVNSLAPGVFPSEMTVSQSPAEMLNPAHPLHIMVATNPLKRSGTPEDFAGTCLYMASRAGAYLNGASIVVDGGRLIAFAAQ